MLYALPKPPAALLASVIMLSLIVLAGCRASGPGEPAEMRPTGIPPGAARTLHSGDGYPVAMLKRPPQSVQELVNRNHAVVIGVISAISGPKQEIPYDKTEADFQDARYQGYAPRDAVAYYDIAIEEVLLDDGNIRSHPRLRLSGAHNPMRPQIGERFLFALGRNPGSRSYGIVADWDVLTLDDGVRNFDSTPPGYAGVTDEKSLVAAVREAALHYEHTPFSQWPNRFAVNELLP